MRKVKTVPTDENIKFTDVEHSYAEKVKVKIAIVKKGYLTLRSFANKNKCDTVVTHFVKNKFTNEIVFEMKCCVHNPKDDCYYIVLVKEWDYERKLALLHRISELIIQKGDFSNKFSADVLFAKLVLAAFGKEMA